nr:MAG TPA: hypothetical protein [Caudoviricetes sp.]
MLINVVISMLYTPLGSIIFTKKLFLYMMIRRVFLCFTLYFQQ